MNTKNETIIFPRQYHEEVLQALKEESYLSLRDEVGKPSWWNLMDDVDYVAFTTSGEHLFELRRIIASEIGASSWVENNE